MSAMNMIAAGSFTPKLFTWVQYPVNENGTIQGKTPGDQTTKEICTRGWYSKQWNVYIECLDDELAERAAAIMEQICADDPEAVPEAFEPLPRAITT